MSKMDVGGLAFLGMCLAYGIGFAVGYYVGKNHSSEGSQSSSLTAEETK